MRRYGRVARLADNTRVALLARFACGCTRRVEIPAPNEVRCDRHGSRARLITTLGGQVRYVALPAKAGEDAPSEVS